ncbi:sugar transporter SWEET1 isoform X2 [Leptinotarsa decemlineata]|uniref:sugar transporter SWEET1 isoform X2 n=1 Tax=Leptinotarsa decemlineata TaxID=7539 RepID=UPI000C25525D|nr:sugar transporter SWEET1 isoform X2 [Leptinotarsa decemlineata]
MRGLSRILQPHKETVGQIASVVTIAQFFSGAFVCKDIYRKGTTQGTPSTPFIGGLVVGMLMLKHAILLNDPAMLQVNVAAIILNIIYTSFYYVYSSEKYQEILKPLAIGVGMVAIFFGYAEIEDPRNLEYRYGLIVTLLMLLLIASPLLDLKQIIEKKDASSIPFPLTFMGAIVSFLWLLYGIILMNEFMMIQNAIGFVLCVGQLILIFMYPARPEGDVAPE